MRTTIVAGATALLLVGTVGGVAIAADQDQARDRDQTCSQECDGDQARLMLHQRDGSGMPQSGDRVGQQMAQEQHRYQYRYETGEQSGAPSPMAPGGGAEERGPGPQGPGTCDGEGPQSG